MTQIKANFCGSPFLAYSLGPEDFVPRERRTKGELNRTALGVSSYPTGTHPQGQARKSRTEGFLRNVHPSGVEVSRARKWRRSGG